MTSIDFKQLLSLQLRFNYIYTYKHAHIYKLQMSTFFITYLLIHNKYHVEVKKYIEHELQDVIFYI